MADALPQSIAPPPLVAPSRLVGLAGVALAAAGLGLAALVAVSDRPDWWRGLRAAAVVSAVATLLSLVPLAWGLRRGTLPLATAGYFTAAGLRTLGSVGGCLWAVHVGGYPKAPTFLMMLAFYFAVLAAEVGCLVVAVRDADAKLNRVP